MTEQNKVTPEIMHLFVLKSCRHACELCCNKFYDIEKIPVAMVEELKIVHTVCVTGGEPFLAGVELRFLISNLRRHYENIKHLYVYTSADGLIEYLEDVPFALKGIDGISFSPKTLTDWHRLEYISKNHKEINILPSNRLYVFKDQQSNYEAEVKSHLIDGLKAEVIGRKWDKEFKTPGNEIFRRLPILLD